MLWDFSPADGDQLTSQMGVGMYRTPPKWLVTSRGMGYNIHSLYWEQQRQPPQIYQTFTML